MKNPRNAPTVHESSDCLGAVPLPRPEPIFFLSFPIPVSFLYRTLLVLLVFSIGHAQAGDDLSTIMCNKNYTNNTISLYMNGIGACSQTNPNAAKINAIESNLKNNQQIINNTGNALFGIVNLIKQNSNDGNSNKVVPNNSEDDDTPATNTDTPAADAATTGLQNANNAAAGIMQGANATMGTLNGGSSGSPSTPNPSDILNSLLDSNQPSDSSTSAISALLGDSTQPDSAQPDTNGTATANTVVGLLDDNNVSGSASAFSSYSQPGASLQVPKDPQFNTAFQDSTNQYDQDQSGSLTQMLQSTGQPIKDSLSNLVSSGRSLVSSLYNDPVVQWFTSAGWNATTAPLPVSTDTPDTVANLAIGQGVVGIGDILKGMAAGPMGVAKGVFSYGSKMVNQMGADLGFANSNIF